MDPTSFFHDCIGQHLGVSEGNGIKSVRIPQRVKAGVKDLSLGQMDCFYIASAIQPSRLIGRVDLPSSDRLLYVATEKISARKYIANWLLTKAEAPFIVGMIGKSHPEPSYRITHNLALTQFCEAGGNFHINVELARLAYRQTAHLDWKKVVAPGIHLYFDYLNSVQGNNAKEKQKLQKHLETTPELGSLLPALGIRPNSGEYTLLSWANIEQKV